MRRWRRLAAFLTSSALLIGAGACQRSASRAPEGQAFERGDGNGDDGQHQFATPPPGEGGAVAAVGGVSWKTAVTPKGLSATVDQGLAWLSKHQLESGGWGQGDEAATMGGSMGEMRDVASVADTSMAVLAFLRAGNSTQSGTYKDNVARGLGYILSEIDEADADSLYVTDVRGTRVQGKIGTYVDTFAALMVLTEMKSREMDAATQKRVAQATSKVLAKIEKNQRADGSWDNQGWAPVLTQSMAAKGLNRAAQAGVKVDGKMLARVEEQAKAQVSGKTFGSEGSAGVGLYAGAANSGTLSDSAITRKSKHRALRKAAESAPTQAGRDAAKIEIAAGEATVAAAANAQGALMAQLDDASFIQGFGNNGGEEFLSYMLVSESLAVKGGDDWTRWDDSITKLVTTVQNEDGSWTGHHCITGRTFCTAAALLVLMGDRTPVPTEIAG
jgi:hypothetical protein